MMETCPECGWPLRSSKELSLHREIKHGIPRFEHEMYLTFPENQTECPECHGDWIMREPGEFVDGGGNHDGQAWECWCKDCDYEWMEPQDID